MQRATHCSAGSSASNDAANTTRFIGALRYLPLLPQHGNDAAAAKSARRHGQHARDEHDAEPEHTGSRNPGSGNAEALSTAARGIPDGKLAPAFITGRPVQTPVLQQSLWVGEE